MSDYDLRKIEPEDDDIDVKKWAMKSAVNPSRSYKLMGKEPVDYFDLRPRYLVSYQGNASEMAYCAYCVLFNEQSPKFKDDLLADFNLM